MKRLGTALICLALMLTWLYGGALADGTWTCSNCGSSGLSGNFCANCGSARPVTEWVCPGCGRTNTGNYCPECGTARASQAGDTASDLSVLTLADMLVPSRLIAVMNESLRAFCNEFASDYALDADDMFEACRLEYTESAPNVLYFDNADWSIELYFYYEDVAAPTVDMPATHWCIAVGGTDDRAQMLRYTAFSSTLLTLYAIDPDIDLDAAAAVLDSGEIGSQFEGEGYRFTYLIINEDQHQIMVEVTGGEQAGI